MTIPRVFISYSHDSLEHKQWILDLAIRLINSGVDAIIDQWELGPGDDLPHFMETQLELADYVVMVCTEKYVEKANSGDGGVGYEKMIVTSSLLSNIDSNKVIPIIRQAGTVKLPTFLKSKVYLNFSSNDEYESVVDELLRKILNAPLFMKPEIGSNPYKTIESSRPDKTSDTFRETMKILAGAHQQETKEYMEYDSVSKGLTFSRALFDLALAQAEEQDFIKRVRHKHIKLTPKGLHYLIEHGLDST